ncbi:biotin--[acetyl-CoA-carboxylase] ligase [Brachyspira hampsonii]|uniref:Biotin--[acetyl-CoA-carboxylase] ligase n=1 Tax=Brachyspira hampsonii TaxID=1287055 RepID=A0AAC9TRM7_9SPIR|nr:biotin--[acetyl-CoA-carboxylase] ligase [Brachyspira hampsonii]ASJ20680.1 biotin--[acetyl-CoA-carboxylase] ligase [Brachyspira hampsonii]ELV06938.1 biotin-(acetyl-CoA carboxylase) ligase [Brachyspira hampsonii 30599]MBW5381554.1 biotin--[acetyl-CoA-carboxylase] ligase [Brachyspira hampsonii]MBW5410808.1 biotin--[acetyl-CoA-carboxylase] ligase [Brachyspira hampsonii]OEJ18143.1 biotin--[acetyl-CoA-carboxylase] ligase [Brachyspira hampsonii]
MKVNIFTENLNTKIYGQNTLLFESLESTNKKMIEDLNNGMKLEEGSVYIALVQTSGKGSYGNKWESNNDLGLWFSILVYSPYRKEALSFLPGIALSKCLREKYNVDAHVKWPNDVLVDNKKISGTLIQVAPYENINACVIGTGVNLYQSREDFDLSIRNKATSLYIETNKKVKLESFYKDLIYYFEDIYTGSKKLSEYFKEYSKMIGKTIKALKDNSEIYAYVKGITEEGYLQVEVNGKDETWISRASLDIDTNY